MYTIHVYMYTVYFTSYNEYVVYDMYIHTYFYYILYTYIYNIYIIYVYKYISKQWNAWGQKTHTHTGSAEMFQGFHGSEADRSICKLRLQREALMFKSCSTLYMAICYTDLVLRCFKLASGLKNKAWQTSGGRGVTCISQIGSLATHRGHLHLKGTVRVGRLVGWLLQGWGGRICF